MKHLKLIACLSIFINPLFSQIPSSGSSEVSVYIPEEVFNSQNDKNLLSIVENDPSFSIFYSLLTKSNLNNFIKFMDRGSQLNTLIVPSNEAFNHLPSDYIVKLMTDSNIRDTFIANHIIRRTHHHLEMPYIGQFTTTNNERIAIHCKADILTTNRDKITCYTVPNNVLTSVKSPYIISSQYVIIPESHLSFIPQELLFLYSYAHYSPEKYQAYINSNNKEDRGDSTHVHTEDCEHDH